MTSDKSLFQELDGNKRGNVTFGDNSKGVIQGIGTIGNTSQTLIKHVLYGEDFVHNLLNISQLHDNGFKICFDAHAYHIIDSSTNKITYIEKGMTICMLFYIDEFDIHNESCLCVNDVNDSWFWHGRLGHANMKTLRKLVINDLAIGLPKLILDKDKHL